MLREIKGYSQRYSANLSLRFSARCLVMQHLDPAVLGPTRTTITVLRVAYVAQGSNTGFHV